MDDVKLKTVLLVEDEAIIALVETKILKKYGYKVIHAGSGEQAVEVVKSGTLVDLILMDIDLGSGIDGTTAAETILNDNDIPLVFLSSHTEPEVVEKTEGITSYGYIVKNSGETVLIAAIRMAFRLFEAKLKVQSHLKQQELLVDILLEFHKRVNQPFQDLLNYSIEVSLKLTGSDFAFAGILSENESVMAIHAWSTGAMDSCSVDDSPVHFNIAEAGVWGECVRQRKPVIINNYDTHAGKHGYPEGHVPITTFMAVPIFDGNRITAVGAVANKSSGYEMSDVQSLISLYEKLWEIIRRKESEKSLMESSERFKALHNASFGGITIHDKGLIIECNQGLADMTGYTPDELIGMDGLLLIAEKSRGHVMENILSGYEKPYEAVGLRKNGEEYPLRLEARNVPYKGKMVRTVEFRDITDIKKSEEALRLNEEKYHALFEDSPEPYLIMDENIIIECNRATELLLRCDRSQIIGKSPYQFSPEFQADGTSSKEGVSRKIKEALNKGKIFFEWLQKRPDSTEFRAEVAISVISLENKSVLFVNWRDISDKVFAYNLMQKALSRFRSLLENSSSLITIFDSNGRYLEVSKAMSDAYGLSPDEIRGKTFHDLLPAENADNFMDTINWVRDSGELIIKTDTIFINGEEKTFESRVFPMDVEDDDREIYGTIAIDITERKESENRIQLLLRETHHRVKNNMNTVYGLLYMQADEVEDHECGSILKDAAWRVQNMMFLYDKLYQSGSINELNIKDYLPPLIDEIAVIFDPRVPVKRDITVEEIVLNAKTVSALGIIINELITNSMKYAFDNVSEGLIHLKVTLQDKEVTVLYHDNGPGPPESFSFDDSDGFGMQLIKMLVQQIKGTIEVENGKSGRTTIRFTI